MKTLPQLAQEALAVQDASNLSGVARSFVKVIDAVRKISPTNNDWKRHPIIKLWVDKLASLTDVQGDWDSSTAYQAVEEMSRTTSN